MENEKIISDLSFTSPSFPIIVTYSSLTLTSLLSNPTFFLSAPPQNKNPTLFSRIYQICTAAQLFPLSSFYLFLLFLFTYRAWVSSVLSKFFLVSKDDVSKVSSDENAGCDNKSRRKELNLNQYVYGLSSAAGTKGENPQKRNKKDDGGLNAFYNNEPRRSGSNNKHSSEGVLAPANWRRNGGSQISGQLGVNCDASGNENKVKKVKLKVGGVTRTIHANSTANGAPGGGSPLSPDDSRLRHKQNLQGILDSPVDKRGGLQGMPWKDFSGGAFGFGKEDPLMGKSSRKNSSVKQGEQSGPVWKSKRVPKKRVRDGEFEDEEDDEIRYLEKLKSSKVHGGYKEDDEESARKQQKFSRVSNLENFGPSGSGKDGKKKSKPDRTSEDTDYVEYEEPVFDGEVGDKTQKKQKESVDLLMDNKREMTLTTRQRALQSSKDASSAPGSSLIEFPNGLPPAPPRKQKEKLTEVEQQLKKAEAAHRRRVQVEMANRESEAQAIRKILGQDSKREKRRRQMKKRQEELAQEKAANALMHASNTIRWTSGPNGTVVTFPEDMGLPSIFDSKPYSYPSPRENCAGPSCTNPYKYRDSKSKLPLCSLQCYKAIQEKLPAETAC